MFSPFTGLLLNADRVGDVGSATSPPYDVISPQERRDLLSASPYNVVRVLLAPPEDPEYRDAAATLGSWKQDEAVTSDDGVRFYLYFMDYVDASGVSRTARGVLGALDLMTPGERIVPHEETRAKHRADRMAAMTATKTNVDVIIGLSGSPDLQALLEPGSDPHLDFSSPDNVRHRLWKVRDGEQSEQIQTAVSAHSVSIADGHHRYLTALAYADERSSPGPWNAILAFVAPAEGSGLTVGPYHRVFGEFPFTPDGVRDRFDVVPAPAAAPDAPGSLVVASPAGCWLLTPRNDALTELPRPWQAASPAVARELLYPAVGVTEDAATYVPGADEALAAVATGSTAILTAPVSEAAIAHAGELGLRFPSKTTFFVPKPRAGLVMRSIAD